MKLELQNLGLEFNGAKKASAAGKIQKEQSGEKKGGAFAKLLAQADSLAQECDTATQDAMTGEIGIHEAMVRMEKADLMLKVGATVRNKVLDAYQQLLSSAGA